MSLYACSSNPLTAALLFPLPCHALLMSLSLTQLLVHRLGRINLCRPAITCLDFSIAFNSVVHSDSYISHIFFQIFLFLTLPAATFPLHLPLSLPQRMLSHFPLSLSVLSISAALPQHEFFMCPSHVSLKLQGRQTWLKTSSETVENTRLWRGEGLFSLQPSISVPKGGQWE